VLSGCLSLVELQPTEHRCIRFAFFFLRGFLLSPGWAWSGTVVWVEGDLIMSFCGHSILSFSGLWGQDEMAASGCPDGMMDVFSRE